MVLAIALSGQLWVIWNAPSSDAQYQVNEHKPDCAEWTEVDSIRLGLPEAA